ncbi:MAG TPA: type II secretion system F family protein [Nitriliruptorales bacterium]|nr:type II secretion system F family protein [Nitriliruptorales bacterium]
MTLLAALLTGGFVYLAAAVLTGRLPAFDRWRPRPRGAVSDRQLWLIQAGADLTPRQFVAGSAAVGVAVLALIAAGTGTPAVAIVPAVAVGLAPRAYFARRRAARMREVQEAWPEGIRELLASISAGSSLHQALTALAVAGPAALQRAFERYPVLARMLGVVPALEVVKEELADPTSDRVIEVLILAHERGGHILTDILRDLADATSRDVRTLEEIATDSLEQRINARAVFVLPWIVLLVLTLRPGHFRDFYRSPGGLVVVLAGAVLSLLGMWVVGRLGREPTEERVFGAAAPPPPGGRR